MLNRESTIHLSAAVRSLTDAISCISPEESVVPVQLGDQPLLSALSDTLGQLASQLFESTASAYIVCVEYDEGVAGETACFPVSKELPRKLGELVEDGVDFTFIVKSTKSGVVSLQLPVSGETVDLHIDGSPWRDEGGMTFHAFSTQEVALAYYAERGISLEVRGIGVEHILFHFL